MLTYNYRSLGLAVFIARSVQLVEKQGQNICFTRFEINPSCTICKMFSVLFRVFFFWLRFIKQFLFHRRINFVIKIIFIFKKSPNCQLLAIFLLHDLELLPYFLNRGLPLRGCMFAIPLLPLLQSVLVLPFLG